MEKHIDSKLWKNALVLSNTILLTLFNVPKTCGKYQNERQELQRETKTRFHMAWKLGTAERFRISSFKKEGFMAGKKEKIVIYFVQNCQPQHYILQGNKNPTTAR